MKTKFWKWLMILSFVPFLFPFGMWIFETFMGISSWDILDFIFLYSFVYWPTYVLGLLGLIVSLLCLKKKKSKGGLMHDETES